MTEDGHAVAPSLLFLAISNSLLTRENGSVPLAFL